MMSLSPHHSEPDFPGQSPYPGACSAAVVRDLIIGFTAHLVADPTEGSGTSRAVCHDLGIPYWGSDLAAGYDLTAGPLLERVPGPVDLVILHPPYFRFIRYSGAVWGGAPDLRDLSQVLVWTTYLNRLHRMVEHALSALLPTGQLALLIGDTCVGGREFSAQWSLYRWYGENIVVNAAMVTPPLGLPGPFCPAGTAPGLRAERCLVIRPGPPRIGHPAHRLRRVPDVVAGYPPSLVAHG